MKVILKTNHRCLSADNAGGLYALLYLQLLLHILRASSINICFQAEFLHFGIERTNKEETIWAVLCFLQAVLTSSPERSDGGLAP